MAYNFNSDPKEDAWLAAHDGCDALARQIMEAITNRNQQSRNSALHGQLNAKIRQMMKQFNGDLSQLQQNLVRASQSYHITHREEERRQRMVENLVSRERQLEMAFQNRGPTFGEGRTALLGNEFGQSSVTSWGPEEEPEGTKDLTVQEIRDKQQQVIKEQDHGLESLSRVITRQKIMAHGIGTELDLQNEIIDDIHDHVDHTKDRLVRETRHVKIIDRKSGTCWYWVIIVLLLIAIVVVAAVKF